MANIAQPTVTRVHWREGMRVTGKYQMTPKEYGEYLARSGKNKHNQRKRKHMAKAIA